MLLDIIQIFFLVLFVYTGFITLYFFITAIAGKLRNQPVYAPNPSKKKIAILIPAYKEDDVIVDTARKARGHDYPSAFFDIFIAADQLKSSTLDLLREIPVNIVEVQFETGSKARSLNSLLNHIPENIYDIAIILDADNIMVPGCLEMINDAFHKGFRGVQVHRTAKNHNSGIAVLDAISEEVNNHLFRKSQRALGFSSNTIGSGMAFEFSKLKDIYNKPGILGNPACDREVDYEIMKSNITIEYIDTAYVLDEKVGMLKVFERQRTRWLESQLIHLKMFFSRKEAVQHKTKDYWNKLFTNLLPPRILLFSVHILILIIFLIGKVTGLFILKPPFYWWLILLFVYILTLFISIPSHLFSLRSVKAIVHIPGLIVSMIRAIFKMKVNRKEFLHTPKSFVRESTPKN